MTVLDHRVPIEREFVAVGVASPRTLEWDLLASKHDIPILTFPNPRRNLTTAPPEAFSDVLERDFANVARGSALKPDHELPAILWIVEAHLLRIEGVGVERSSQPLAKLRVLLVFRVTQGC